MKRKKKKMKNQRRKMKMMETNLKAFNFSSTINKKLKRLKRLKRRKVMLPYRIGNWL